MGNETTVETLRGEVAALRAELAALRATLATELRTGRVVVADDDGREVDVTPGRVGVSDPANDCHVSVLATGETASVEVHAGEFAGAPFAELAATVMHYDTDKPPCHAWVAVDGDDVAVPVPG